MQEDDKEHFDVLLVGAGIMSATLATLLKELDIDLKLIILERQESCALESSNTWNNAGTGHAGLCELNYTKQYADGSIDIKQSLNIHCMFEMSKQFWSYLITRDNFGSPKNFIHSVPHLSFVRGEAGIKFLKKRFTLLKSHHCFKEMIYSDNRQTLYKWIPLMIEERSLYEKIAATKMLDGTDVDFGALTKQLFHYVEKKPNTYLKYNLKVTNLDYDGRHWCVKITKNDSTNFNIKSSFVFIGAGGGSLQLLQLSDIPEGKGFGGFPVSGQWLRCNQEEIVIKHKAKVYSQAEIGSPPMSMPHLDTRIINGKKSLLFGPYAGFSTKFLRYGSFFDLPSSIRINNILPMLAVARDNISLTKYLINQITKSKKQKINYLKNFYPGAKFSDWTLENAGQRVQIIKKDIKQGGILQFGTELVTSYDGSLAALLGASPGASVSVSIMLNLLKRCFPNKLQSPKWTQRIKEIFLASEKELLSNPTLYYNVHNNCNKLLELQ